jgi:hypothetical protein
MKYYKLILTEEEIAQLERAQTDAATAALLSRLLNNKLETKRLLADIAPKVFPSSTTVK